MKSTHRSLLMTTIAGVSLLFAGAAIANPDSGGPAHHPRFQGEKRCLPSHLKKQLPLYDKNKDGQLDRKERRAMHDARRRTDLAAFDVDRDGRLSQSEQEKLHRTLLIEHFEELDDNRDAEISIDETIESCTPIEHHFDRIDIDSNGRITWAEFEYAAPGSQSGRHHPKPSHQ